MDETVADNNTTITVKCQGCESECEVTVVIQNGVARCLGGNNCPTGESFALAQARDHLSS